MLHKNKIVEELSKVLANSFVLSVKTQNFHWNIDGPHFYSLHAMFESQYKELAEAIDKIAERIRALGMRAPGSLSEFLSKSSLKEESGQPKATDMLRQLLEGHETLVRILKQALVTAQTEGDDVTVDMMIERIKSHEKAAWMLRSSIVP